MDGISLVVNINNERGKNVTNVAILQNFTFYFIHYCLFLLSIVLIFLDFIFDR